MPEQLWESEEELVGPDSSIEASIHTVRCVHLDSTFQRRYPTPTPRYALSNSQQLTTNAHILPSARRQTLTCLPSLSTVFTNPLNTSSHSALSASPSASFPFFFPAAPATMTTLVGRFVCPAIPNSARDVT
jgi:hypothetical protein